MDPEKGLIQRRNIHKEPLRDQESSNKKLSEEFEFLDDSNVHPSRLTLMEEVLLLGLKDKEGYTSFWNDTISSGLRACIIVELAFRGRLELEKNGMRPKPLLMRKLVVLNDTPTGDVLLDEALKYISNSSPPEGVQNWIDYLSGESWNLLKIRFQMKNVRERLAKNLVEKGVLTTTKQNFLFFDLTTHPLTDNATKSKLVKKLQEGLTSRWTNDVHRMDARILALILLSNASNVLENAFVTLEDEEYDLANRRLSELLAMNYEHVASKSEPAMQVFWAVCLAFSKS